MPPRLHIVTCETRTTHVSDTTLAPSASDVARQARVRLRLGMVLGRTGLPEQAEEQLGELTPSGRSKPEPRLQRWQRHGALRCSTRDEAGAW